MTDLTHIADRHRWMRSPGVTVLILAVSLVALTIAIIGVRDAYSANLTEMRDQLHRADERYAAVDQQLTAARQAQASSTLQAACQDRVAATVDLAVLRYLEVVGGIAPAGVDMAEVQRLIAAAVAARQETEQLCPPG